MTTGKTGFGRLLLVVSSTGILMAATTASAGSDVYIGVIQVSGKLAAASVLKNGRLTTSAGGDPMLMDETQILDKAVDELARSRGLEPGRLSMFTPQKLEWGDFEHLSQDARGVVSRSLTGNHQYGTITLNRTTREYRAELAFLYEGPVPSAHRSIEFVRIDTVALRLVDVYDSKLIHESEVVSGTEFARRMREKTLGLSGRQLAEMRKSLMEYAAGRGYRDLREMHTQMIVDPNPEGAVSSGEMTENSFVLDDSWRNSAQYFSLKEQLSSATNSKKYFTVDFYQNSLRRFLGLGTLCERGLKN